MRGKKKRGWPTISPSSASHDQRCCRSPACDNVAWCSLSSACFSPHHYSRVLHSFVGCVCVVGGGVAQRHVPIPTFHASRVAGYTCRRLEREYSCHIEVPGDRTACGMIDVHVYGPSVAAVEAVEREINLVVRWWRRLDILEGLAGLVIGKHGANIKRMKRDFGCSDVSVAHTVVGGRKSVVVCGPTEAAVDATVAEINRLATPRAQKDFTVSKKQASVIIANVSETRTRYGCPVTVLKEDPEGCGVRVVEVGPGPEADVDAAVASLRRDIGWTLDVALPADEVWNGVQIVCMCE
jgi:hypothetical protein